MESNANSSRLRSITKNLVYGLAVGASTGTPIILLALLKLHAPQYNSSALIWNIKRVPLIYNWDASRFAQCILWSVVCAPLLGAGIPYLIQFIRKHTGFISAIISIIMLSHMAQYNPHFHFFRIDAISIQSIISTSILLFLLHICHRYHSFLSIGIAFGYMFCFYCVFNGFSSFRLDTSPDVFPYFCHEIRFIGPDWFTGGYYGLQSSVLQLPSLLLGALGLSCPKNGQGLTHRSTRTLPLPVSSITATRRIGSAG